MQLIVDSLLRHPFIAEILVWNNNPAVTLQLRGDRVRVIDAPENELCYGRFLCAAQARHETIYFQDDDVIVENVPALYEAYCQDDSRIVHALASQHLRQKKRYAYPTAHVALLGWGAFAQKRWLAPLERYVSAQGADFLFKREADKFFTLLQGRQHRALRAQLKHLPGGYTDGVALYRERDHERLKAMAVRRALGYLRTSQTVMYPVPWHVVVVCYNYGRFLEQAVNSVLANDADYVVTIVDDASTDDSAAVADRLSVANEHVNVLRHEKNLGVSRARNNGIAAANSLFVVTLDADDRLGPNYLYEAEKLLRSGCDVANPDAILFGAANSRWPVPASVTLRQLLQRNRVHCAAAFRRSYWVQVGGIDENMDHWWDYDFWIRLASAGARIRRLPGDHFYYRRHGAGKSQESARMRDQLRAHIQRKHQRLYRSSR
jgi:hypothetical protein